MVLQQFASEFSDQCVSLRPTVRASRVLKRGKLLWKILGGGIRQSRPQLREIVRFRVQQCGIQRQGASLFAGSECVLAPL